MHESAKQMALHVKIWVECAEKVFRPRLYLAALSSSCLFPFIGKKMWSFLASLMNDHQDLLVSL